MIPFATVTATGEASAALRRIEKPEAVLSLTFFIAATDGESYRAAETAIATAVRDFFPETPPPVSVIAQAPEGGEQLAIEASVLAAPGRIERRSENGDAFTVVTGPGGRQVHGAGISSNDPVEVFSRMAAILEREGLTFGHVVRQWGYIEGMLDVTHDRQGYQEFNDARTTFYDRSEFPAGYPAATGIGQAAGGVVLEFIALDAGDDVTVAPISNPRQVDAHVYSEGVLVGEQPGKTPPKFERAKRVTHGAGEIVFVSGTASILGEESVAVGDVAGQTETTIENISVLTPDGKLSRLRAYVKRAEDIAIVRRVCEARFGQIPALYVTADVCRDELLVEIEGLTEGGAR